MLPQFLVMSDFDFGPFPSVSGYDRAVALDAGDVLANHRSNYLHTDERLIYLDGNSLGRLPRAAGSVIDDVVERQWGDRLIRSWNEGWWELQLRLGKLIAPLVGANPDEVIVSDSTSVNLYKLAHAAVTERPGRTKIVTDDLNFPTDVYILEGIAGQLGMDLVVVESDGMNGPMEAIAEAIDTETALVSISHTVFKSGFTYDLDEISSLAHDSGALTLIDCSHSVGAMPIDLSGADVDLAVGCTYKYLNGGPGSPAFLYVRRDLQERLTNPITAWWGHAEPFAFDLEFRPVQGIRRFHAGTMPIISLAAAEAGIADVSRAGVGRIRTKSEMMSEYLLDQWQTHLQPLGFGLASPTDVARRGSHISLTNADGWPLARALIEVAEVIPDFRAPDIVRFGLSPLYNSFEDIHTAVQRLRNITLSGVYEDYREAKKAVT